MYRETTQLVLGRGEVYFDLFATGAVTGEGERYIGNTPSFQITREIERMERRTSYRGQTHEIRGVVLSESVALSMTTDHMSRENAEMWFTSESDDVSAGEEYLPFDESITVRRGRYYQLGTALAIGGVRFVDRVTITNGATPLVAGSDFLLERENGRIVILPDAPNVEDGDEIDLQVWKRPNASQVLAATGVELMGALRYVATNVIGPRQHFWFPQVRIAPRGGVDLKGDQWRQISFDATPVRLTPNTALLYALKDNAPPTPITADTTLITADTTLYTADHGAWEYEG